MMCHMQTGLQAPTQTAATGSWKVSMSGTSPAIRRPLASPDRPRPSATAGQLLAGLAVDDRRRSPPTNCLVIEGCANDVKVAGVVDQVGLPEPSFLSFHGSAGRAMMRYNSAILGD